LCEGGELLDRIDSGCGLDSLIAHCLFAQLVRAVEHMHGLGVCHRDLKPENILLGSDGALKIADFGLATVTKILKEKHIDRMGDAKQNNPRLCTVSPNQSARLLKTKCGTLPYMAPEIFDADKKGYRGELVDVWSCGIILYLMLFGEHPWSEAMELDPRFELWSQRRVFPIPRHANHPLSYFETTAIELLKKMLAVSPLDRICVSGIKKSDYFTHPNPFISGLGEEAPPLGSFEGNLGSPRDSDFARASLTQPLEATCSTVDGVFSNQEAPSLARQSYFFSQPASPRTSRKTHVALETFGTDKGSDETFGSWSQSTRLTRFAHARDPETTRRQIAACLESLLVRWRSSTPATIYFMTVDKNKSPLHGRIVIISLADEATRGPSSQTGREGGGRSRCLVLMRKSRGDTLEFGKLYAHVCAHMSKMR